MQSSFFRRGHNGAVPLTSALVAGSSRGGSALIVVLVLIVMLSLAAYSFSERMITENESSEYALKQAQARACAESGIEYAALMLDAEEDPEQPLALYHDPAMFAGVSLTGSSSQVAGRFTFVAPYENDSTGTRVRAGLIDESAKLNLNAISSFELDEDQEQLLMMNIPGMTEEIADAILDWIDEDDDQRISGAENDDYESLSPPYTARNAAIESLDELLLVQGMTPLLLYGEDANRNGLLDPNENDADATLPLDNGDGLLDPGLAAYFTVDSLESNLQPDGSDKIDVNQDLLADMYDQIAEALGEDEALFITAFALYGATNVDPLDDSSSDELSTGNQQTDEGLQNAAAGMARAISGGEGVVTRAGLDLTQGRTWTFDSLFDLVDAEVEAEINQETKTLKSPWSSGGDPESFKTLFDTLSTTTSATIEGRVNINEARREVLLGIPGMLESVADSIVSSQLIGEDGTPMTDTLLRRSTPGWLLLDGLVDVTTMRQLDKYVTAGGDVFRLQVLGHLDGPGPIVRIEATIDRTESPPRVVSRRDLAPLGPGYRPEWLVPAGNGGNATGIP
ncbi:MAG: general secretion pathway protein GspK [Planctomycetaceae bacterium]|nr:general secretion pathway protein GspK [Planctomycetaceae bacterium]